MRILVTGGSGFIGGHLIEALTREGFEVVAPVRAGSGASLARTGARIVEADLLDGGRIRDLMKGIDAVCHLASVRGSGWSFNDEEIRQVNVGTTGNLLDASAAEGVGHFVYVSSVSTFGHPIGGPIHEGCPCSPVTRYGKSKWESERLVADFEREGRIAATIIRPVITYGPGDTWGMVPKLVRLVNSRTYMTVGTGENRVHLIYIDDLIDGLILALKKRATGAETYIMAGEEPVSINRLVKIISAELNQKVSRFRVPVWFAWSSGALLELGYKLFRVDSEPFLTRDKVDVMCRDRFFDSGKAKKGLGFQPKTAYESGLRKTIDWLRSSNQL